MQKYKSKYKGSQIDDLLGKASTAIQESEKEDMLNEMKQAVTALIDEKIGGWIACEDFRR